MEKTINKILEVGDVLYWHGKNDEIKAYTISKVGNKYFYLEEMYRVEKFDINTLRYTSSASSMHNIQLYRTENEIKDNIVRRDTLIAIKDKFKIYGNCDLSTDQLTRILTIINETI